MELRKYRITVASDRGIIRIKVIALSKERAVAMVMKAENCPSYAILDVTSTKVS